MKCLNLRKDVSFLKFSGSSLNSRALCTEKARLRAFRFVLGVLSQGLLLRVDILWLNCLK